VEYTNSKLNTLGYLVHYLRPILGLKILKLIYFSYVHWVLNYGVWFWGNLPHSRSIFITQEQIVKIIMKAKPKDSYKEMYRKLGILTFNSQCILSTFMFVVKYKNIFIRNTELHKINTRHKLDFHVPLLRLTSPKRSILFWYYTI
jgi:hypothetical protein